MYDERTFDEDGYAKPQEGNKTWNKKADQFNQEWRKVRETPSGSAMHERIKSDETWTYSVDLNDYDRMPDGVGGNVRPHVLRLPGVGAGSRAVFPDAQFDMDAVAEEMYHQMQKAERARFYQDNKGTVVRGIQGEREFEKMRIKREGTIIPELPVHSDTDYENSKRSKAPAWVDGPMEAQAARAVNVIKYEYLKRNDTERLQKSLRPVHPSVREKFGIEFQGFRQAYERFYFDKPFGATGYPNTEDVPRP